MGMSSSIASRLVLESILCYEQDYFECIQAGQYREPWDTTTPNHRQSNPLFVLQQTSRFVREAVGTMGRRSRGTQQDKDVPFFRKEAAASANAAGNNNTTAATMSKKTNLYPDYYQTAFHYQGDGWMSKDSANVYETSTETLFLGRQDAMQRTTLPPLVDFAKKRFGLKTSASSPPQRSNKRPMRVLEVACGTGRFLTYVRDNLPLNAEVTAVDLSPFYLEKAAENDEYWRRTRLARERRLWGPRAGPIKIPEATLVQARAEELPFGDNAFDAVVCVYLCHEIPRHIRAKAAAEMARVVAPGGIVVLTDSVQKGDRPALDDYITNFSKMNEPFYKDFANDDLGKHFEKAGLVPKTKRVRSNTKSLSFAKPEKNDDDVPSL
jgi:ubiquinone/menaquinone biosynthesis C-methylase UbiE